VRSVFLIGPDKKIKAMLTYPMSSGRNFDEVLRLLDSCQLTARHRIAMPVNWKPGDNVIIAPSVSDDQARQQYPGAGRPRAPICASSRNRASAQTQSHTSPAPSRRAVGWVEHPRNPSQRARVMGFAFRSTHPTSYYKLRELSHLSG
jgi:C-terminal domain of 1-Cys peroxiredoxin